jgi:hypothetical protein
VRNNENVVPPNVVIVHGAEFFPDRKDPQTLYLAGNGPGEPLNIACQLTPARFKILQELAAAGTHRVAGYNAMRLPVAFAR